MTTPLVGKRQAKEPRSVEPPRETIVQVRAGPRGAVQRMPGAESVVGIMGRLLGCEGYTAASLLPFPRSYPFPALLLLCPLLSRRHCHARGGTLRAPVRSPCGKANLRRVIGCGKSEKSGAYAPPALRQSNSGMPMALALSARLPVTPEPGNTTTPMGSACSSWSLRLNGAAF